MNVQAMLNNTEKLNTYGAVIAAVDLRLTDSKSDSDTYEILRRPLFPFLVRSLLSITHIIYG